MADEAREIRNTLEEEDWAIKEELLQVSAFEASNASCFGETSEVKDDDIQGITKILGSSSSLNFGDIKHTIEAPDSIPTATSVADPSMAAPSSKSNQPPPAFIPTTLASPSAPDLLQLIGTQRLISSVPRDAEHYGGGTEDFAKFQLEIKSDVINVPGMTDEECY